MRGNFSQNILCEKYLFSIRLKEKKIFKRKMIK